MVVTHVSHAGLLSVDVYSKKHAVFPWRTYHLPTGSSRGRLRAVWRLFPSKVVVFHVWSAARTAMVHTWGVKHTREMEAARSFISLATSGRHG